MPQIARSVIDYYTDAVNDISRRAQGTLGKALASIDYSGDPTEVRRSVLAAMDTTCKAASQMSARTAADYYDGMRERVLGKRLGATVSSGRYGKATEKAVKAFLRELFDGEYDEFERLCMERVDYEVKRAAGRCVQRNVELDPYQETRYARVPTGEETCDFCIMLASRGPVYHTEESAGAYDHYHTNCDCRIVPFWGTYAAGDSRRASDLMGVEGYDPDALYRKYCEQMLNPNFADRMARAAETAKARHGRATTHAQKWSEAYRNGTVTLGSIGDIKRYLDDATSYEDLFERVKFVNKEMPYYGLSDSYYWDIQDSLDRIRKRFLT